jgi:hypothetical protein
MLIFKIKIMRQIFILFAIFLHSNQNVGQSRYAKIIDFEGTPQYADQIVEYRGNYCMAYTQVCIDEDGELFESCGGVIKLDDEANMLDSNLIRRFSDNNECIVVDSMQKKIYLTGEEYFKQDYAQRFTVNEFPFDDFKNIKQSYYKYPSSDQINYFQFGGATILNKKLTFLGSTRSIAFNDIKCLIFALKNALLDTTFLLDFGLGTFPNSTYLDTGGFLSIHIYNQIINSNENSIILKLDTNYQEVWRWESPKLGQQLPFGCGLKDGRSIVAMHTLGFSNIGSIWCINEDKSVSWKMEFPEKSGKIKRNINRLKQLKDGSIVGCGVYGNLSLDKEIRILEVPFIFKITKDGQFLWEKAFYNIRPILDFANGYFSDVIEVSNGDLIAVGRIDDYLEFDPIAMTDRPDPDILIVRTDANGCIDDECATVTKINKIVNTQESPPTNNLPSAYLFPNPSMGEIELMNHFEVLKLTLYNAEGALVKEVEMPQNKISISGLPSGMYFVKIYLKAGKIINQKIIIH